MPKVKTSKSRKYGVEIEVPGGQWYATVPSDTIQPHPDNPNHGDVEAIRESIQENDFYGAIVVQASTGRILAGEHRWRAARAEGLDVVPVIYRDCDDHTAIRIMLVDNETARRGDVDPEVVQHLLQTLESIDGTGYDLGWLEQQEAERQAGQDADEARVVAGKASMVDDSDLETQFAVIVMVDTEIEQETAFSVLSEIYGAERLRAVSV